MWGWECVDPQWEECGTFRKFGFLSPLHPKKRSRAKQISVFKVQTVVHATQPMKPWESEDKYNPTAALVVNQLKIIR